MRKKLLIAATVLILLLLAFIATLQYRQYSSYKVPMPAAAHNVVKVNADELIQLFVKNYGFNFKKKISKPRTKKEPSLNTGIWLPANLFLYNLRGVDEGTWFGSMPLADEKDFLKYTATKWKIQWQQSNEIYYGRNASGNLQLACNNGYVSVAFGSKKQNVQQQLNQILGSSGMNVQHAALTSRFKKMDEPVAAIGTSGEAALWFKGNELMFKATADSIPGLSIPSANQEATLPAETHSFVSINGRFAAGILKPAYNIKQYSLHTDSLLQQLGTYTYFSLGADSVQKDSITTYEFDDNFEKVAKVTVTKVQVPALQLSLSAAPGLLHYLQRQGFVSQTMMLNKEVFPLYSVQVKEKNGMLHFNTHAATAMQLKAVPHFAAAKIDVAKVAAKLQLETVDEYLRDMVTLQAKGTQQGRKIILEGSLLFKNNALKALVDIANRLQ